MDPSPSSALTFTRVWHGALAVLIAVAVVWQTVLVVDEGDSVVNLFSYFTIQSNLLMMVAGAGVALDRPATPLFGAVRLAGLVGITVTGIVYATVLAGSVPLSGVDRLLDTVFHYVVPLASFVGFVLIQPRTPLARSAWWALAWPIAWLAYTLVRAEVGSPRFMITDTTTSRVPYDFLDAEANGVGFVVIACVLVTIGAVVIAAGYLRVGGVRRS